MVDSIDYLTSRKEREREREKKKQELRSCTVRLLVNRMECDREFRIIIPESSKMTDGIGIPNNKQVEILVHRMTTTITLCCPSKNCFVPLSRARWPLRNALTSWAAAVSLNEMWLLH